MSLSHDEKERIKNAFRSFDGRITTEQNRILKDYNLIYDNSGKGEAKIKYPGLGYVVAISKTPSDRRTGLNMVKEIVGIIVKSREYEANRKKPKKDNGE